MEQHAKAWNDFQKEQIRYFVQHSGAFWDLYCLMVLLGTCLHQKHLDALTGSAVLGPVIGLCTGRLALKVRGSAVLSDDFHKSYCYCVLHNAIAINSLLLAFSTMSMKMANMVVRHKAFVSTYLLHLFGSSYFVYLPVRQHLGFVTFPAVCCWMVWHWNENFLSVACAMWGLLYASGELVYFRMIERHRFHYYQTAIHEKAARMRSEALERALQRMLNSVFDASCECDHHGTVLAASQQLEELLGASKQHLVGKNLKDLTSSPAEHERMRSFLAQNVVQADTGESPTIAAKIATSMRHITEERHDVDLVVCCVAIPCDDSVGLGARLLIGCQRTDEIDVVRSSHERALQEDIFNVEDIWEGVESEPLCRLPHFPNLEEDFSELGSLSISHSGISLAKPKTLVSVGVQTEPTEGPIENVRHRHLASAGEQTEPRQALVVGAYCQTDPFPYIRPPLPRVDRQTRCKVSFRSRSRWWPQFQVTPEETLQFIAIEFLGRINPSGIGCCSWHLGLAAFARASKALVAKTCTQERNQVFQNIQAIWQCTVCLALNDSVDYFDEDDEDDAKEYEATPFTCTTCGETSSIGPMQRSPSCSSYVSSDASARKDMASKQLRNKE